MNLTDAPQCLFTAEIKPGANYGIPWLDELQNKVTSNTNQTDVDANDVQSDNTEKYTDYSSNTLGAISRLQENFTKYDGDSNGALSYEELTSAGLEDPAAKWAQANHKMLSEIASEPMRGKVGSEAIGRYIPDNAAQMMFADVMPVMAGVSKQDLYTALEVANDGKMTQMLQAGATAERSAAKAPLFGSIFSALAVYPAYKLLSKRPILGQAAGLFMAISCFSSMNKWLGRRNANSTELMEEQINKTRKMLGMNEIAPVVHPDKQKKDKDEKNENMQEKNVKEENIQKENVKEKNLQEQNLLNQCIQKSTDEQQQLEKQKSEKEEVEQKKLEQNSNAGNLGDQSLMDQSQIH